MKKNIPSGMKSEQQKVADKNEKSQSQLGSLKLSKWF